MYKIEDVGLGKIEFSQLGESLTIEIWSTYDGHTLGTFYCNRFDLLEIKHNLGDEEMFGVYIALIQIENIDNELLPKRLTMESGDIWLKVECAEMKYELTS